MVRWRGSRGIGGVGGSGEFEFLHVFLFKFIIKLHKSFQITTHRVRVVKEVDSKSTGLRPRRFESCRCGRFLIAFIDPVKSHYALIGFIFCGWTICDTPRSARCREHAGSEIASTTSSIENDREMGSTAECLYTAFRGRSIEAMRWGRVEASMGGSKWSSSRARVLEKFISGRL